MSEAKAKSEAGPGNQGSFLGGFLASRGGTFVRLGTALGMVSTGALTATGDGTMSPLIGSTVMFIAVAFVIAGMAFSLGDYPLQSVMALIVLPPARWVFFMGLPFVARDMPSAGWAAALVGICPLLMRGDSGEARA